MLLLLPAFIFSSQAASNKGLCKLRFGKIQNGVFINSFIDYDREVTAGRVFKLPAFKDKNGKRAFWQVIGSDEVRSLRSGERCVITENTRFALYWKKIFRISFYNTSGTAEYTKLQLSLTGGENFSVPVLRDTATHYFAGWSFKKNAASPLLKPNRTVKARKDYRLYAV